MVRKVHILIICLQNKDLLARTNIRVQHLTSCKNLSYNPAGNTQFCVCFARKTIKSSILHFIDGVRRKYILRIGLRRFATPPNKEYIFFQLAVNIMQNCRLKIAITLEC